MDLGEDPMPIDEVKKEILKRLECIKPYKVILFGSSAYGSSHPDSDIDLLVVTDNDYLPKNYKENMENYHMVSSLLRDLKKNMPMDLIVHTKPMHDAFIHLGSMFAREVLKKGEVLYEKDI
jgi:uncharacterized protein